MSRKRVTKSEKLARDNEIQSRMLEGWSETEIVKHYSKEWECSDVNVRKYLYAIMDTWRTMQAEQTHTYRNKYLARLEMLYKRALNEGHLKTALDTQKEINKVCGLHAETGDDSDHAPIITISKKSVPVNVLSAPEGSTDASTDEGS